MSSQGGGGCLWVTAPHLHTARPICLPPCSSTRQTAWISKSRWMQQVSKQVKGPSQAGKGRKSSWEGPAWLRGQAWGTGQQEQG